MKCFNLIREFNFQNLIEKFNLDFIIELIEKMKSWEVRGDEMFNSQKS